MKGLKCSSVPSEGVEERELRGDFIYAEKRVLQKIYFQRRGAVYDRIHPHSGRGRDDCNEIQKYYWGQN